MGYNPLWFDRYLMMMVKGVFQSNGILKEFSFQTRQEDLTTAFRCRTLDWGLSTLRSDPVKAVTPDQLPVVRHHCPVGNLYLHFCVASSMLSPFLFIDLESTSNKYNRPEYCCFNTTDFLFLKILFLLSFLFNMLFFLSFIFFPLPLLLRWGGGGCKGGGEGRCSGRSGTGGDCSLLFILAWTGRCISSFSIWCLSNISVWVDAVARPTNVLKIEY